MYKRLNQSPQPEFLNAWIFIVSFLHYREFILKMSGSCWFKKYFFLIKNFSQNPSIQIKIIVEFSRLLVNQHNKTLFKPQRFLWLICRFISLKILLFNTRKPFVLFSEQSKQRKINLSPFSFSTYWFSSH